MSYRKITVNDKRYEYVIGKTHTKIKGVGLFKNSDIGVPLKNTEVGAPFVNHDGVETKTTFVVTPAVVADIIAGKPIRSMHKCYHGTVTSKTMLDVLSHDVYNEIRHIAKCELCDKELASEI